MRRYKTPKRIRCAICNKPVDRSACNQTFAIITIVRDLDAIGTKHGRQHLCGYHASTLESWLNAESLKYAEETREKFGRDAED